MAKAELVDYIKGERARGVGELEIHKALTDQGWQLAEIDEAFKAVKGDPQGEKPMSGLPAGEETPDPSRAEAEAKKLINSSSGSDLNSNSSPSSGGEKPAVGEKEGDGQPADAGSKASPGSGGKLPGAIDLLKESWGVFKDRVWTLVGIWLVASLAAYVPALVVGVGVMVALGSFGYGAKGDTAAVVENFKQYLGLGIPLVIVGVILLLVMVTAQIWGQLALIQAVKDRKEQIGWKEAFARSRRKLWAFGLLSIFSAAITLGGFALLVIPGIILAIWFSLGIYVLVGEGVGGFEALMRSKKYVEGYWWGVLWRMVVLVVVMMGLAMVMVIIPVAGQLGIGLLLTPLMLTYFYLMYEHLRELKGGAAAPEAKTEGKRWPWVIVAVVGLLAFLAVPAAAIILTAVNPVGQIAKARDASRLSDQQMIQGALERYFLVYGSYPQSLNTLVGAGELQEIPKDYQTQMPYDYQALNEGKNFRLCVKFESQDAKKLHDECVGSMGMPTATPGVGESGNYVTNLLDQQTARWDLARSAQMQSVKTPLELYYAENEVYPENLSDLVPKYFGQELKDPRTGEDYFYQQSEEGQNYLFCVSFESTEYENQLECVSKDGYSNKPNNSELNIDMENSQGM